MNYLLTLIILFSFILGNQIFFTDISKYDVEILRDKWGVPHISGTLLAEGASHFLVKFPNV